jgi:hypothetical protein
VVKIEASGEYRASSDSRASMLQLRQSSDGDGNRSK